MISFVLEHFLFPLLVGVLVAWYGRWLNKNKK